MLVLALPTAALVIRFPLVLCRARKVERCNGSKRTRHDV
jgi:hypothetical protein